MFWVGAAILLVLIVWARKRKSQQQDTRDLRTFEHTGKDPYDRPGFSWVTTIDFPTMRMALEVRTLEDTPDTTSEYYVRRGNDGRWQTKMTEASVELERKRLLARKWAPAADEEIAALDAPQSWVDLTDEVSGAAEVQYQRFLLHWHEST